jgi:aminoglycoside 6'-N-acetyltransferase I
LGLKKNMIEQCNSIEQSGWLLLREALWPHCNAKRHLLEMSEALSEPKRFVAFVAYEKQNEPIGFAEASVRSDYVNGTESSPVAFLEGIYVVPNSRRQGIARTLIAAIEGWAVAVGCKEFASDASLENSVSHTMHRALGFQETERVVYFRKSLA